MFRYAFQKVGMTCIFTPDGVSQGVTVLRLLPNKIVRQQKTENGLDVIVVEYDSGVKQKIQRGWKVTKVDGFDVGSPLKTPEFKAGERVKITGESKGQGFQDAMTRHNFRGGPATHGSRFHRAPGSVGMRAEPGRTPKGKKLPGHMGAITVSVMNLEIAYWSPEESLLAVVGGVPGARGSSVFI